MLTRARLRVAVGVLAAALAAENAYASDPQLHCTTNPTGSWTITVTGPISVPCPEGGPCTELDYQIVANAAREPRRAAVLVEHDVEVVVPPVEQTSEPCLGDRRTKLGLNDCSHKTVRIEMEPGPGPQSFRIVADGLRDVVESSIAVKGQGGTEGCRIASLGSVAFHPNQQVVASQEISFKGCTVTIPTDPVTGEGGPGTITGGNCVFVANAAPVSAGELTIGGQSVGVLSFGDGSFSSGTGSCTTKIVNRRLYTWCTCDTDGEDPVPPCSAVP